MPRSFPVYVVDDDSNIREWACLACEEEGITCRAFPSGTDFLEALDTLPPGCVLLDMRMPRPNGLDVQRALAERELAMPVIAMTGFGDVDVAVQSMKLGAIDFLEKPFGAEVLREALARGFARLRSIPVARPD